jgi:hypothetical protein
VVVVGGGGAATSQSSTGALAGLNSEDMDSLAPSSELLFVASA